MSTATHSNTTAILYIPDAGFTEIASGPLDLLMDAEACEAAHAERIVAALAAYVDTDWQRREYVTPPLNTPPPPPSASPAGGVTAAGSPRCDVAGCDAPGEAAWVGAVPRYPVTLCDAHQQGRA